MEILKAKTVKELQEISKGYGLTISVGKTRKKKDELVEQILEYEGENKKEEAEEKVEKKEVACHKDIIGLKEYDSEKKAQMIDNAEIGQIVAAIFPVLRGEETIGYSVKSAKIVNKSKSGRKLKLETSYGRTEVVKYEDVVWVKDGRWPGGIIKLFNTTNKRKVAKS